MQEFKLKHLLLKLFEITISYHSSGVNTLQCHFMYKNLKSFVSRCECVSCFENLLKTELRIMKVKRWVFFEKKNL